MAKKHEVMLWNKDLTASVRASKLRDFTIASLHGLFGDVITLTGWYNKNESFSFGEFKTKDEAREYLREEIIKKLES